MTKKNERLNCGFDISSLRLKECHLSLSVTQFSSCENILQVFPIFRLPLVRQIGGRDFRFGCNSFYLLQNLNESNDKLYK